MTDSVINSQTQSPLIRILAAVDSAAGNFTQHVADNVPPVSFTEVEIDPVSNAWDYGQQARFQIPQLGYIEHMELIFNWKRADGITARSSDLIAPMEPLCYELWQRAALQTRRRDLERLEAVHQATRLCSSSLADTVKQMYDTRFHCVDPSTGAWSRYLRDTTGTVYTIASDEVAPTYEARCSLPFSVMQSPALQLQSLFVESLEVAVDTRALYGGKGAVFQKPPASNLDEWSVALDASSADFDSGASACRLRIRFRNFHDETENVIRNENYVSGTPATILCSNVFAETPQPVTPPASLNRAALAAMANAGALYTALAAQTSPITVTNPILSKNLAYGISFALTSKIGGATSHSLGYRCVAARLVANGQTLQAWSDEDLHRSLRQSFLKTMTPYGCKDLAGYAVVSSRGDVGSNAMASTSHHPQQYTIQMGMQYGTLFNTGAMGLSSLSSVQLQTDWVMDVPALFSFGPRHNHMISTLFLNNATVKNRSGLLIDEMEVSVWVEHFQLLRIDPDNGALSVSLDI